MHNLVKLCSEHGSALKHNRNRPALSSPHAWQHHVYLKLLVLQRFHFRDIHYNQNNGRMTTLRVLFYWDTTSYLIDAWHFTVSQATVRSRATFSNPSPVRQTNETYVRVFHWCPTLVTVQMKNNVSVTCASMLWVGCAYANTRLGYF